MVFGARKGGKGQPPDDDGLDAEAKKASREAVCAEYFASLPTGSFTAEEEDLRAALQSVLTETGNVRLSIAAQREEVRSAKQKLSMPQGAGLTQWLTQRAGDDFSLVADPNSGEKLLCLAGHEHEADAGADSLEDFYASLPDNEFTEDEAVLREHTLLALKRLGGRAKLSQFTRGDQARELQQARGKLLPKGAPFVSWLERRLGSEVSVEAEAAGGHTASLLPAGRSAAASLGRAPISGANATQWQAQPQQPRLPPPMFKDSAPDKGKGKGKGKYQEEEYQTEEDREATREQAKADREARVQEFFDKLPSDALTLEEQVLREALFVSIERHSGQGQLGVQVRLSRVCQEPDVRNTKVGLLPEGVTVATWIEARVGGEIILSKDESGQVMCERAGDEPPAAVAPVRHMAAAGHHRQPQQPQQPLSDGLKRIEERDARMVEYFQSHPNLSVLERSLKNSLLEAVARKHEEAPTRLSDVLNSDSVVQNSWKSAKANWAHLNPPLEVAFARWVELRMGEEVKITREPYVQLSRQEKDRRGLPENRKRGAEAMGGAPHHSAYMRDEPPAKMSRVNGAGPGAPIRPFGAAPPTRTSYAGGALRAGAPLGAGPPARALGLRQPGAVTGAGPARPGPIGIRPAYGKR